MKKVLIGFVVIAALALACGEEEEFTGPAPEYLPTDVLENVETSFNQRNIGLLGMCLSPAFVFRFDPRDVGQRPPGSEYVIPESWAYDDFWRAAKGTFDRGNSINFHIPTSAVGAPGENETTYKAEEISISLLVMVTDISGYLADKGYCNFEFEKYTGKDGNKYWRLTGWWDRTSEFFDAYPGVAPTSLGRILAVFN